MIVAESTGGMATGLSKHSSCRICANIYYSSPISLYTEHTTSPTDACTAISIQISDNSNPTRGGAVCIGGHRRVLWDIDPTVKRKITLVALWRGPGAIGEASSIPGEFGTFDGMTAELNRGRSSEFLYIVWSSVPAT